METKHTSLPWTTVAGDVINFDAQTKIASCGNQHAKPEPKDLVNAAFIVRAVNAHDALVDALVNLLNGIDTGAITSDHDETFSNAVQKARAAITKAIGEA